jgi:hypothetical protein
MGIGVSFSWAVGIVEWSGSETDQSPPSSADVKHDTFRSSISFYEMHREKFTLYLVLSALQLPTLRLRFSVAQFLTLRDGYLVIAYQGIH